VQPLSFAEVGQGLQAREFDPFFQPKIELETGQVKGLEMFARWRHPLYGVLGPASFMQALEENRRIDFLDWSMIENRSPPAAPCTTRAFRFRFPSTSTKARWRIRSSWSRSLPALSGYRIMPDYITFEMTESAVLTTDPHFLERLLRLRMKGFGLAIDDYGTGRSNLQLLARIPFSELKIDRSFVDGASKKQAIGTVLRSYLGLARSLDRRSVAVGVAGSA
jgi:EAL domain-containing protein (putative c-di-GMP-specific phosphodiesterase class I)